MRKYFLAVFAACAVCLFSGCSAISAHFDAHSDEYYAAAIEKLDNYVYAAIDKDENLSDTGKDKARKIHQDIKVKIDELYKMLKDKKEAAN